jgi:hypothetical protein
MKLMFIFLCIWFYNVSSFALTFRSDVPISVKNQMIDDLKFVDQIQGNMQTPFHRSLFGSLKGQNYKVFFEKRISAVAMDDCGSPNTIACVLTYYKPINIMWLTENYYKFSQPSIARVMTIFHEARHTENKNNNWFHADCPIPFLDENGKDRISLWTGVKLEGLAGCDETAFGSYGISVIMLQNISKFCTNCSEKIKMDADIYSSDELNRMYLPTVKKSMQNDFNTKVKN